MLKTIIALLGVIIMVLMMPVFDFWSGDQRFSPRLRRFFRKVPMLTLIAYVLLNLTMTLLCRTPGTHSQVTLSLLEPFQRAAARPEEAFSILEGLFQNVLLFLPLGYLLPMACPRIKNPLALLAGSLFTAAIELCQLVFGMGWFDVNDLLYNVIGMLCGLILIRVQQKE